MVENFIKEFTALIVDNPDEIRVEREDIEENFSEIFIYANKADTGKLIGKDGKMISSLKTVVSACKAKDGRSYRITIKANEE